MHVMDRYSIDGWMRYIKVLEVYFFTFLIRRSSPFSSSSSSSVPFQPSPNPPTQSIQSLTTQPLCLSQPSAKMVVLRSFTSILTMALLLATSTLAAPTPLGTHKNPHHHHHPPYFPFHTPLPYPFILPFRAHLPLTISPTHPLLPSPSPPLPAIFHN